MKLLPTPKDARDHKFFYHKLFGIAGSYPDSYIVETNNFPNQNGDNRPNECTAYTLAEIGYAEDGTAYSRDYNFAKTLEAMNASDGEADARTAFEIPTVFGYLPKSSEPNGFASLSESEVADISRWPVSLDTLAAENKKPAYIPIASVPDYFDGIRSALYLGLAERRIVGMATQWSASFEQISHDGILPESPVSLYWGHMYAAVGWKTIYGVPYLILKTWQGPNYGDDGYCYMSRALCNRLMGTWGAYAASIEKISVNVLADKLEERADLASILIALCQNVIGKLRLQLGL